MAKPIVWKAEYSVNNKDIDYQHQYLFDLYNMLYLLVDQPESSSQSTAQALAGLQDYIKIHFQYEEKLYTTHPLFTEHKELHEDFIRHTNNYISDLESGNLTLSELANFIYDWLVKHITVIDNQYFRDLENA